MPDFQYHPDAKWPETLVSDTFEHRVGYFEAVKLGHPLAAQVKKDVLSVLEASFGSNIILLTGAAGVGKTVLCKNVVDEYLRKDKGSASDIPCVYIQAGATDDHRFDWKDFFNRILMQCAAHLVNTTPFAQRTDGKVGTSDIINYAKAKRSKRDLQIVVEDILKFRNTKVLVIDEAQHIFQNGSDKSAFREMEFVKSFAESTGLKIILSGTYHLLCCTQISAQLSRRLRIIDVPRYDIRKKDHAKHFMSVLNQFLRHYPACYDSEFHNEVERFYVLTCGCVGLLKDLLTNALLKSADNGYLVGFEEVDAVSLRADGLRRIAEEISVGERYFKNEDLAYIKKFLGLKNEPLKSSRRSSRKAKHTPGKRKPSRDKAGAERLGGVNE